MAVSIIDADFKRPVFINMLMLLLLFILLLLPLLLGTVMEPRHIAIPALFVRWGTFACFHYPLDPSV